MIGVRLEPDVGRRSVSVGDGGLGGGIGLVGGHDVGAALPQRPGDLAGQRAQAAELADDQAEVGRRRDDRRQPDELTERGNTGTIAGLPAVDAQRSYGVGPANAVGTQSHVALKGVYRVGGGRAVDAVGPSTIEAEPGQRDLQLVDVVAAQLWCRQLQQPIAEAPGRFDERRPRGLVAAAVLVESALGLEGTDRLLGRRAEVAGLDRSRFVSGGGETAL